MTEETLQLLEQLMELHIRSSNTTDYHTVLDISNQAQAIREELIDADEEIN